METKRLILICFSIFALMGILNCILIEPTLAYKDDPAISQEDEVHCCFICHSMHHQWVTPQTGSIVPNLSPFQGNLSFKTALHIDPLPTSIFHPPLSF